MANQSTVCACAVCAGPECQCGCQNPAVQSAASCQCGEVCGCGPACTCKGCPHPDERRSENR